MQRFEREEQLRSRIRIFILVVAVLLLAIVLFFVLRSRFKSGGSKNSDPAAASVTAEENVQVQVLTEEETEEPTEPETLSRMELLKLAKPDIDISSWEYILANTSHNIEEYTPEVASFEGVQLDVRIIDAMSQFVADTRAQGLSVVMSSGYRDYWTQTALFQNKVNEYGDEDVAATIVARPGTSEHQTGLAADITDQWYQYMNESLENTQTYQWMSRHCQDYGFIVRFPKGKEDITGIIYEPWHYRYVGKEAAAFIMENGLTLEEFVELYE